MAALLIIAPSRRSPILPALDVATVTITVTDDNGGVGSAILDSIILVEPSGFVTGGGWIDSPAGAVSSDPTLTGKATFGFVARHRRGATSPSGSTEFQFAGINFHSTSYDSLVITFSRAEHRGRGTANGDGAFRFTVTIIDELEGGRGGGDRFRIRIWDALTGQILYDSQPGDPDDADPTAVLEQGSMVIHYR